MAKSKKKNVSGGDSSPKVGQQNEEPVALPAPLASRLQSITSSLGHAVFVDTAFLIAVFLPKDENHEFALELDRMLDQGKKIRVLTNEVLCEFLNFVTGRIIRGLTPETARNSMRERLRGFVEDIYNNRNYHIIRRDEQLFRAARTTYFLPQNHAFSATDCYSINEMRELKINQILTSDRAFNNLGFETLLA